MKWFRLSGFITLFAALVLTFNACEDTVDPDDNDGDLIAPTNLQVSSRDQNTLRITWKAPSTLPSQYFYEVLSGSTVVADDFIDNDVTQANIGGLTAGTIYTIRLYSATTAGAKSTNYAQVQWAPAYVYTNGADNQELRLYSWSSTTQPSGLNLYDGNTNPAFGAPERLKVADKANWDLGFNDEGGTAKFGSASLLFPGSALNSITQIADFYYRNIADLATAVDSLNYEDGVNYTSELIDLKSTDVLAGTGNLVLVARTRLTSASNWNYAKIMIFRDTTDNDYVFGSGATSYIKVAVSYQYTPGVPFAKRYL